MAEAGDSPPGPHTWVRFPLVVVFSLIGGLIACTDGPSILDSASADAQRIERLWWVMLAIAGGVFMVILWLLIGSVVRSRRSEPAVDSPSDLTGRRIVFWGGLVGTSIVLIVVMVISTLDLRALTAPTHPDLRIRVIGEQFWWRVEYPDHDVVTANEIHVPAGSDIAFSLESGDVIHSFWVPQAGPKRDMIPGQINELNLQFNEERVYRGICAEFCGLQHAQMQLLVVARPEEDVESWIESQVAPAPAPTTDLQRRGQEVFTENQCVGCHTIRGVSSAADSGPDLTHLASRLTLGAGGFDLTHENLTRFVRDPDSMKPGIIMPPAGLSENDLEALIAYLESLR